MNGHVFQLHAERKNKAQFADTMETLRICSSKVYRSNIELLTTLFTEQEEPWVAEPKEPETMKITRKDGKVTEVTTKSEEKIYNKRIK